VETVPLKILDGLKISETGHRKK